MVVEMYCRYMELFVPCQSVQIIRNDDEIT